MTDQCRCKHPEFEGVGERECCAICGAPSAAAIDSDTAKRLQRAFILQFDPVARCVAALRDSVEEASGYGLPLHDALIGQRSDSTFWTRWERNKASLRALLDALDEAFPLTEAMSRAARSSAAGEETIQTGRARREETDHDG